MSDLLRDVGYMEPPIADHAETLAPSTVIHSPMPFDALERNIMGTEISGLLDRMSQLLEAAG